MDSVRRIALIAPFGMHAKGTTRARVIPIGQALVRRGHQVAVFIPPYDDPSQAGRSHLLDGVDITCIELTPATGGTPGLGHVALGLRLARAAHDWAPDLIHVFKPKGPAGIAEALTWIGGPRQTLVVDADDWEGAGGWNDDPRVGYSPVARRVFAWQERFGLSHADAWTVTSDCLRARAIGFGADARRVVHLPNGVSRRALEAPMARHPEPNSVLLYTRFAGVRVTDIAAVWSRVRAAIPTARLTVIGRGLATEEEEVAGLPGVTSVGWVAAEELPSWFSRSAVAILPWADTPANRARHSAKLLELMAAGVPIVASAVGEIPATVNDAGELVRPGDPAAFAASVVALLRDRERQMHLSVAAAKQARQFTWDVLMDRALAAYDLAQENRMRRRREM